MKPLPAFLLLLLLLLACSGLAYLAGIHTGARRPRIASPAAGPMASPSPAELQAMERQIAALRQQQALLAQSAKQDRAEADALVAASIAAAEEAAGNAANSAEAAAQAAEEAAADSTR